MVKKLFIAFILFYSSLAAAERLQVIRDAEIENNLKNFMLPLVKAANLNPDNINILIVEDSSLNAFVTNGMDMFINSGLIVKFADDPNVLYGVMAHEIAHIYAGHLSQLRSEHGNMSKVAMGGMLLGLASAFAGAPEVGLTLGSASMQAAEKGMLSYSREHEVEADKVAVKLLYKTNNNGEGLITFFQYMNHYNRYRNPDPYSITHPLNNERIASVKTAIKNKLGKFGDNITPRIRFEFKRMATKLQAYMGAPGKVIKKYQDDNYGLSIGYFRYGKLQPAIEALDKVLNKESNNPYLWELKGQFYYENGKFDQAVKYYQKALDYLPKDKLIKVELASAKIHLAKGKKDKDLLNSAIILLKQVTIAQPNDIAAHYMMSLAYGKLDDKSKAILALAEYYSYLGSYKKSEILAKKVLKMTSPKSREYLRASDIIKFVSNQKE